MPSHRAHYEIANQYGKFMKYVATNEVLTVVKKKPVLADISRTDR